MIWTTIWQQRSLLVPLISLTVEIDSMAGILNIPTLISHWFAQDVTTKFHLQGKITPPCSLPNTLLATTPLFLLYSCACRSLISSTPVNLKTNLTSSMASWSLTFSSSLWSPLFYCRPLSLPMEVFRLTATISLIAPEEEDYLSDNGWLLLEFHWVVWLWACCWRLLLLKKNFVLKEVPKNRIPTRDLECSPSKKIASSLRNPFLLNSCDYKFFNIS